MNLLPLPLASFAGTVLCPAKSAPQQTTFWPSSAPVRDQFWSNEENLDRHIWRRGIMHFQGCHCDGDLVCPSACCPVAGTCRRYAKPRRICEQIFIANRHAYQSQHFADKVQRHAHQIIQYGSGRRARYLPPASTFPASSKSSQSCACPYSLLPQQSTWPRLGNVSMMPQLWYAPAHTFSNFTCLEGLEAQRP